MAAEKEAVSFPGWWALSVGTSVSSGVRGDTLGSGSSLPVSTRERWLGPGLGGWVGSRKGSESAASTAGKGVDPAVTSGVSTVPNAPLAS